MYQGGARQSIHPALRTSFLLCWQTITSLPGGKHPHMISITIYVRHLWCGEGGKKTSPGHNLGKQCSMNKINSSGSIKHTSVWRIPRAGNLDTCIFFTLLVHRGKINNKMTRSSNNYKSAMRALDRLNC